MMAPDPPPVRRLFKSAEAALYLGISPRTLWSLASTDEIPSVRFGSGTRQSVRFDIEDLRAWLESKKGGRR